MSAHFAHSAHWGQQSLRVQTNTLDKFDETLAMWSQKTCQNESFGKRVVTRA